MPLEVQIPAKTKALNFLTHFLQENSRDPWASLHPVLLRWVEQDELLASNLENPLVALRHAIEGILSKVDSLYELVRQVDVHYAQTHSEKPIFQKPGEAPHPDDEYTHQSVEKSLRDLLAKLP